MVHVPFYRNHGKIFKKPCCPYENEQLDAELKLVSEDKTNATKRLAPLASGWQPYQLYSFRMSIFYASLSLQQECNGSGNDISQFVGPLALNRL